MQEDKQVSPGKLENTQLIPRIQKLQSRSNQCFNRVIHTIQKMINKIQECQGIMKEQSQKQVNTNQLLNKLQKSMIQIKPLKTVREEFNNYYKRLSAFGKEISVDQLQSMQLPEDIINGQYFSLISDALSQHFLREGKWKAAETLSFQNSKLQIFKQCANLRERILKGQFDEPIKWTQSQKLYETYDNLLQYQLKKMNLLKIIKLDKAEEAIEYYKNEMQKFVCRKESQINKLIAYILFSTESFWKGCRDMPQRYIVFLQENRQNLAKVFSETYLHHYGVSSFDSIQICHKVGLKHKQEFIRNYNMISENQKVKPILPFSLALEPNYKYHSQFLCPVSKQLLSSKEGTVLFKCGHVISDAAYNKILESKGIRKKLKCPVCQEQQKVQQVMQIQF